MGFLVLDLSLKRAPCSLQTVNICCLDESSLIICSKCLSFSLKLLHRLFAAAMINKVTELADGKKQAEVAWKGDQNRKAQLLMSSKDSLSSDGESIQGPSGKTYARLLWTSDSSEAQKDTFILNAKTGKVAQHTSKDGASQGKQEHDYQHLKLANAEQANGIDWASADASLA